MLPYAEKIIPAMASIKLTPVQRKTHRALAHHLDPVVMIGNDGLTSAVVKETDLALSARMDSSKSECLATIGKQEKSFFKRWPINSVLRPFNILESYWYFGGHWLKKKNLLTKNGKPVRESSKF